MLIQWENQDWVNGKDNIVINIFEDDLSIDQTMLTV